MLLGRYIHNLDAKGRVIMPSKLREELGDTFVVAKGFDSCLAVYSEEEYGKLAKKVLELPSNLPETRILRRQILAEAQTCEADKQGRFIVPPLLREMANLTREVVIVGNGDHAELWDSETWNKYLYGEEAMSFEDAAASLHDKGWSF